MNASEELFVTVPTGVRLCYQTFGNPSDPAVLLISGAGGSMIDFRPGLIALLSPPSSPHYIIRFDNRDTGRSTAFPVPADGAPAYTLADMVADIVGLIEHLGVPVHLVGGSFGGPMAYIIAAQRPELVRSLILFLTSPTGGNPEARDNLPPVKEEGIRLILGLSLPGENADRAAWVEYTYGVQTVFASLPPTEAERDEARATAELIVEREWESGTLFTKTANHGAAAGPRWPRELLARVRCPAMVVQAEGDQFFDLNHGAALARDIVGAEYVLLKGVGHEIPRRIWIPMAEAMLLCFGKEPEGDLSGGAAQGEQGK